MDKAWSIGRNVSGNENSMKEKHNYIPIIVWNRNGSETLIRDIYHWLSLDVKLNEPSKMETFIRRFIIGDIPANFIRVNSTKIWKCDVTLRSCEILFYIIIYNR